jgi:hypothetical protein
MGASKRVRFLRLPERHSQNGLTALIVDLNHEAILLIRGQIIPVGNNLDKDLSHSQGHLTGSLNIGQIIAFGISNPTLMTGNKQSVLGHGDKEYQPSTSSQQSSHRYYFLIC